MFSKEFYPTPKTLIRKMLEPYIQGSRRYNNKLDDLCILEPSAGKGDIIDFIQEHTHSNREIYAIELNQDLQSILYEKEVAIIGNDFLQFNENYYFDLIVMNPPFSNGDEHLLKAIEVAKQTDIVCLLNAETIRNPYTKQRKILLDKINQYGSYEFLESEFKSAERKTNVEIALVRLTINKEDEKFDFDFDKSEEEKLNFDFDFVNNQIAREDLIGNLNIRYEEVRKEYAEYLKAREKYLHYKKMFLKGEGFYQEDSFELSKGTAQQKYNHLSMQMKKHMWRKVIKELDVQKYMSAKVSSNFEAFIRQQSNMSFTKENVASFFQMIMNNRKNIWDQAVEDVFDKLTEYWKENRSHVEGWKTNDRFKINRKVILPYGVKYGAYSDAHSLKEYGDNFSLPWDSNNIYNDIDKCIAYLAGHTLTDYSTLSYALEEKFNQLGKIKTGDKFDNTCESAYFKIKFFKKGTVHIYFKDKKLWDLFNMTACATKNWLPDDERTKWEEHKKKRRESDKQKKQNQKPEPLQLEKSQSTLF
jgi:phospholipid N-methyltransferase